MLPSSIDVYIARYIGMYHIIFDIYVLLLFILGGFLRAMKAIGYQSGTVVIFIAAALRNMNFQCMLEKLGLNVVLDKLSKS